MRTGPSVSGVDELGTELLETELLETEPLATELLETELLEAAEPSEEDLGCSPEELVEAQKLLSVSLEGSVG